MTKKEKIKAGVEFGGFVTTRKSQRQNLKNHFETNKIGYAWARLKAQELNIPIKEIEGDKRTKEAKQDEQVGRYISLIKGKSLCSKRKLEALRTLGSKTVLSN